MTGDLVAFLRARLLEDEQTARAAEGTEGETRSWTELITDEAAREQAHNARHSPARVLAEVDAKRKLANLHSPRRTSGPTMPIGGTWQETVNLDCQTCGGDDKLSPSWLCMTIRLLAQPYAGHPDYQSCWALDIPAA